jgi:peptidoglycan/LPS O-acetylase OafA/YrhL
MLAIGAISVSVVFALATESHTTDPLIGTIGYTLLAITFGAALIVGITARPGTAVNRVLNAPSLRWMGKYSYGLYVFHQPIAVMLPLVGITARLIPPLGGLALFGQLLFSLIAGVITVTTALASWHFLEKHFLGLKRRFDYGAAAAAPARMQ